MPLGNWAVCRPVVHFEVWWLVVDLVWSVDVKCVPNLEPFDNRCTSCRGDLLRLIRSCRPRVWSDLIYHRAIPWYYLPIRNSGLRLSRWGGPWAR